MGDGSLGCIIHRNDPTPTIGKPKASKNSKQSPNYLKDKIIKMKATPNLAIAKVNTKETKHISYLEAN